MTKFSVTMLKVAINYLRKASKIVSQNAEDAVALEVSEKTEELVDLLEAIIILNEDEVVDNVVYVAPARWGRK